MLGTIWISGVFCTIILIACLHYTFGKTDTYYRVEPNADDIPCYSVAILFSWITFIYLVIITYKDKKPKKPKDSCKKR